MDIKTVPGGAKIKKKAQKPTGAGHGDKRREGSKCNQSIKLLPLYQLHQQPRPSSSRYLDWSSKERGQQESTPAKKGDGRWMTKQNFSHLEPSEKTIWICVCEFASATWGQKVALGWPGRMANSVRRPVEDPGCQERTGGLPGCGR